jgi:hypothetical protein
VGWLRVRGCLPKLTESFERAILATSALGLSSPVSFSVKAAAEALTLTTTREAVSVPINVVVPAEPQRVRHRRTLRFPPLCSRIKAWVRYLHFYLHLVVGLWERVRPDADDREAAE